VFLRAIFFAVRFLNLGYGSFGRFLGNVLKPLACKYVLLALLRSNRPSAEQNTTANEEQRREITDSLPRDFLIVPSYWAGVITALLVHPLRVSGLKISRLSFIPKHVIPVHNGQPTTDQDHYDTYGSHRGSLAFLLATGDGAGSDLWIATVRETPTKNAIIVLLFFIVVVPSICLLRMVLFVFFVIS